MNLYEKLLLITNDMKTVAKNLEVGVGKSQYKAVGEADVLKAVKELEFKYKVYSYPSSRKVIDNAILETVKEYTDNNGNTTITKSNQLFMRIETVYTFVNVENPEETISITTYGDGIDGQDKAPGKAMTYADKYGLLKAYKIVTGEDPDQQASPEQTTYKKGKRKTPYDFENNAMTEEQAFIIASLTPEQKEVVRNHYKKDIMKLTKLEADNTINSLKKKGLIKTKEEQELEKKEKEEVF